MSFLSVLERYHDLDLDGYLSRVTDKDVEASLSKDKLNETDLLNLLSPRAAEDRALEVMAQKARQVTLHHFGKAVLLYIPLYLANYCSNECVYCGFNVKNRLVRSKLSMEEIEANAKKIAGTGMKHILILTGDAPKITPLSYLTDAVAILKKYFSSISVEVYPMDREDYFELKKSGADGVTIYQECYDRKIYDQVHIAGQKKDYEYRLNAPERAAQAGMRTVNVGTLFGLGEPVSEAFFAALHAKYLQDHYPGTEASLSLPRMNDAEGGFKALHPLGDREFVQFIMAYRLFLPSSGITLSTRERAGFREKLVPLGVTKFSAGSDTSVGGYIKEKQDTPQFEVNDTRDVEEIKKVLIRIGYDPVFKDWDTL